MSEVLNQIAGEPMKKFHVEFLFIWIHFKWWFSPISELINAIHLCIPLIWWKVLVRWECDRQARYWTSNQMSFLSWKTTILLPYFRILSVEDIAMNKSMAFLAVKSKLFSNDKFREYLSSFWIQKRKSTRRKHIS